MIINGGEESLNNNMIIKNEQLHLFLRYCFRIETNQHVHEKVTDRQSEL